MKIIISTLLTLGSFITYGQHTTSSEADNTQNRFMCQHVEVTPDNKKIFLRENVSIETENLILKADSAVFDYETQMLIAYGMKELTFNGGETVINDKTNNNVVRYRLRDRIIYIE